MPYLAPEEVLERFSRFTLSTVRPAIPDDEEFVRGQTGSMASTLRFLAGELEGREEAVAAQERTLRDALDEVAATVDDEGVVTAVEAARDRIDEPAQRVRERETRLLEAAEDVLAAVDAELDGEAAQVARQPLYGFLDDRVAAQLRMLGGEPQAPSDRDAAAVGSGDDGEGRS
jgi:hypothetical protein